MLVGEFGAKGDDSVQTSATENSGGRESEHTRDEPSALTNPLPPATENQNQK